MTNHRSGRGDLILARTVPIRPSKLGVFTKCALRYLFETERIEVSRLNPPFFAIAGTAVHSVIQRLSGEVSIDPLWLKDQLIIEIQKKVSSDLGGIPNWINERHGCHALIGEIQLNEMTRFTKQQLERSTRRSSRFSIGDGRNSVYGAERWLESVKYDVAGRADLVLRERDSVIVTDFKLGFRRGDDGEPSADYVLQLGGYALLVEENLIEHLPLWLELRSPKDDFRIKFSDELRNKVVEVVEKIRSQLPRGRTYFPSEVAQPGPGCKTCAHRIACASYRSRLEISSHDSALSLSDTDFTAEILAIECHGALMSVRARSVADGRRVLVEGIPISLFGNIVKVGMRYEFFSAKSREPEGRSRLISNFYVIDESNLKESATSFHVQMYEE